MTKKTTKSWTATVVEDPLAPDEVLLQFPEEMMIELDWHEGDTISWDLQKNGSIVIKKVNKAE